MGVIDFRVILLCIIEKLEKNIVIGEGLCVCMCMEWERNYEVILDIVILC